jgi:hypothetical protein
MNPPDIKHKSIPKLVEVRTLRLGDIVAFGEMAREYNIGTVINVSPRGFRVLRPYIRTTANLIQAPLTHNLTSQDSFVDGIDYAVAFEEIYYGRYDGTMVYLVQRGPELKPRT